MSATFTATLPAATLAEAMGRLAQITPARNTIPILGHALLRFGAQAASDSATTTTLHLTATDMDRALTLTVEAEGTGEITVPADRLAAIVRQLESGPVALALDKAGRLAVTQGRSVHRLPTLPVEDYPTVMAEPLQDATVWQADARRLADRLAAVAGAASTEETRYYLNGVFFDCGHDDPHLVTTDGDRMAATAIGPEGDGDGAWIAPPAGCPGIIWPNFSIKPLIEMARSAPDGRITLAITPKLATAEAGGERIWTRLIDGRFPDWRRVVPAEFTHRARVDAEAFARAVDRVGIVEGMVSKEAGTKRRRTYCALAVGAEEIALSARGDGEEAEDAVACRIEEGKAGTVIGFRADYLAWAIRSLAAGGDQAGEIDLHYSDPMSPVLLTRADDPDRRNRRIVMPARV